MNVTIGMPCYKDFHGVFFTLQAIKLYHNPPTPVEYLVVDTSPIDDVTCAHTKKAVEDLGGQYVSAPECNGPAAAKNRVFLSATGDLVVCLDCHVLLAPLALTHAVAYFRHRPDCKDLLQGPLLHDAHNGVFTHMEPRWGDDGMFGVWGEADPRGNGREPFAIPMQGMGCFAMLKAEWPGFNALFRGFGGEEGYIHEKVRRLGGRTVCHPQVKWLHRFARPEGAPYPLSLEDRVFNYLVGFHELGMNPTPMLEHYRKLGHMKALSSAIVDFNKIKHRVAATTSVCRHDEITAEAAVVKSGGVGSVNVCVVCKACRKKLSLADHRLSADGEEITINIKT